MKKKTDCESCSKVVPASATDDFCIPEESCPKKGIMEKYPSPTTCKLIKGKNLTKLKNKIDAANKLLLSLAPMETHAEELDIIGLDQKAFEGIMGQKVKVNIKCLKRKSKERLILSGEVVIAGSDFAAIKRKGREVYIPYAKIYSIDHPKLYKEPNNKKTSLRNINSCLKRDITFQFAEAVSASPDLLDIFFGRKLYRYLKKELNNTMKVWVGNKFKIGKLIHVTNEAITLVKDEKKFEIPWEEIDYLKRKL